MSASAAEISGDRSAARSDDPSLPHHRKPGTFTPETSRRALEARRAKRATEGYGKSSAPSDEAIERGLRQRAITSAKDAEVLLRWLTRPRTETSGMGLSELSEEQLEAAYHALLRLSRLGGERLEELVQALDNS